MDDRENMEDMMDRMDRMDMGSEEDIRDREDEST